MILTKQDSGLINCRFHDFYNSSAKIGLFSDVHFDHPNCNRKLYKKHLEESDYFFINGDLLCVRGAKKDPRSVTGDIRPEYSTPKYLDEVIDDAIEFHRQYKDKIIGIGYGNHETAIIKHKETDPIHRITQALGVPAGGYRGWVRFQFVPHGHKDKVRTKLLNYHHGAGGGARRSKGILSADLDLKKYPQADMYIRGHDHNSMYVPLSTIAIDKYGFEKSVVKHYLRTGHYKDSVTGKVQGWETEKDFDPQAQGGWFANFSIDKTPKAKVKVKIERAI